MLNQVRIPIRRFRHSLRNKVLENEKQAIELVKDKSQIMVGGFGICGIPENLIEELRRQKKKGLNVISNTCGLEGWGLGRLLEEKQISRFMGSYVGENRLFQQRYLEGDLAVEFVCQGSLAEKIRCGGAGVYGFYTQSGINTMYEYGGIPIKYSKDHQVQEYSQPKKTIMVGDQKYIFEESIVSEYGLIKAMKADLFGNLQFNKTAQNFNYDMAMASETTIVEVEEIVDQLDPSLIHLPGIFVDWILQGNQYCKQHEKKVVQKGSTVHVNGVEQDLGSKMQIVKNAMHLVEDGDYINLGIGIPQLLSQQLNQSDKKVMIHSENGILGIKGYPEFEEQQDSDLINAGKESITASDGVSYFSSSLSFAIIRGHHLSKTFLGAFEVSQAGDIANWIIPNKLVKGMGGAMDLVNSKSTVIVCMTQCDKQGYSKIKNELSLPCTGKSVVSYIVTEYAIFQIEDFKQNLNQGILLIAIRKDVSFDFIIQKTGCQVDVSPNLKYI